MPRFSVNAAAKAELVASSTPTSGQDLEALPWVLFDTDLTNFTNGATNVVSAGFQSVNADKTISNMEAQGQLPAPQFFDIAGYCLDILATPVAGIATTGNPIADIANLLKTALLTFRLDISQKQYGQFPATWAHASGGEIGSVFGAVGAASAVTTAGSFAYGNNGVFDGGWWWDAAITLQPTTNFSVTLNTKNGQALTLTQTPMPIRQNLWGILHRRVL